MSQTHVFPTVHDTLHPPASLRAIVYVSSATWLMSNADLDDLLSKARELNTLHRITGVLLYHRGTFMQYFEGGIDDVVTTYNRILVSQRHHQIIELMNAPIGSRQFGAWTMGLCTPTPSTLLELATAQWRLDPAAKADVRDLPVGVAMLRRFWDTMR